MLLTILFQGTQEGWSPGSCSHSDLLLPGSVGSGVCCPVLGCLPEHLVYTVESVRRRALIIIYPNLEYNDALVCSVGASLSWSEHHSMMLSVSLIVKSQ